MTSILLLLLTLVLISQFSETFHVRVARRELRGFSSVRSHPSHPWENLEYFARNFPSRRDIPASGRLNYVEQVSAALDRINTDAPSHTASPSFPPSPSKISFKDEITQAMMQANSHDSSIPLAPSHISTLSASSPPSIQAMSSPDMHSASPDTISSSYSNAGFLNANKDRDSASIHDNANTHANTDTPVSAPSSSFQTTPPPQSPPPTTPASSGRSPSASASSSQTSGAPGAAHWEEVGSSGWVVFPPPAVRPVCTAHFLGDAVVGG
eukprot:gene40386-49218_t